VKIAIITDQHFGARKNSKLFHDYFLKFYEDIFFPTLIKEGMIMRTSRGRLAQDSAYELLGIKKTKDQQRLFNDK